MFPNRREKQYVCFGINVDPIESVLFFDENFQFFSNAAIVSKARHRGDILEFTIKNNHHLSVVGATFYLFVRGDAWIADNGRDQSSSSIGGNDETIRNGKQKLSISINRFVHRYLQQVKIKINIFVCTLKCFSNL